MKRLTWKDESGYYAPKNVTLNALKKRGELVDRLAAYEDTGLTPEEIEDALSRFSELLCYITNNHMSKTNYTMGAMLSEIEDVRQEACERYCDLKQAEQEGRLVVLPCKVGDTVWFNTYKNNATECVGIQPHEVKRVNVYFLTDGAEIPEWEFGKTIFLSREEAEKALEVSENEPI